jgi:hypothetical protein
MGDWNWPRYPTAGIQNGSNLLAISETKEGSDSLASADSLTWMTLGDGNWPTYCTTSKQQANSCEL